MTFALLTLWTFVLFGRPQDFFPALAPLRPALVLGVLSAGALFLQGGGTRIAELLRIRETKHYLLFYLVLIAGIPLSYYRGHSFKFLLLTYLSNMLFYFMVLFQVDSLKKVKQLFFTISLSVLFYASLSLVHGQFLKGRFFAGTMYDSNDLAFFLVSLFPLAFPFAVEARGGVKKLLAFGMIGVAMGTMLLTGSRGGLVGLASLLLVVLFGKKGNSLFKRSHKTLLVLVAVAAVLVQASRINIERFASLGQLSQDYNITAEEGRLTIWKRGLELAVRNPVFGVGADCFPQAIGEMREQQGGSPKWQVAHNAYLQVLAEAGVPAFILFLSVIIATFRNFSQVQTAVAATSVGRELNGIAGALSLGFIACLTTAFFLSQAYSILFTLFFAFGTAVRRLYQAMEVSAEPGSALPDTPFAATPSFEKVPPVSP
jgi:O-antigen ligase